MRAAGGVMPVGLPSRSRGVVHIEKKPNLLVTTFDVGLELFHNKLVHLCAPLLQRGRLLRLRREPCFEGVDLLLEIRAQRQFVNFQEARPKLGEC